MFFSILKRKRLSDRAYLKKPVTYEELYSKINNVSFPCGKAVLYDEDITFTECKKFNIRVSVDSRLIAVTSKYSIKCFSASELKELRVLQRTVMAIILDKMEKCGYY